MNTHFCPFRTGADYTRTVAGYDEYITGYRAECSDQCALAVRYSVNVWSCSLAMGLGYKAQRVKRGEE